MTGSATVAGGIYIHGSQPGTVASWTVRATRQHNLDTVRSTEYSVHRASMKDSIAQRRPTGRTSSARLLQLQA